MSESIRGASILRSRLHLPVIGLGLSLLVGCPEPKPPPIPLERPPVASEATGTLEGTMYLVAGQVDLRAQPITPALQRARRIAIPRRQYTGWLVSVHNRSSRPIMLNPRFDEWSAVTRSGKELAATPATRLRLEWFMDSISPAAVEVISYPDRIERGQEVEFPIYVGAEGAPDLASMRFWSRDVEDDVVLVDPGLLPVPLPLAGRARVEALTGEAEVIVGQDEISTPLKVGTVIRANDVVVLGDETIVVIYDEWGSKQSYEIRGPDTFRVVPPGQL